ncbi:GNAT family N-acetyltransferase [Streptococcus sp. P25B114]
MLNFIPINPDNWRIPLSIFPSQTGFVADKMTTLAQAFAYREFNSQAYLIYDHQLPVGLIMYHDSPQVKAYHLSEFFIDKHYQVQGYDRQDMNQFLDNIRREKRFSAVELCILENNDLARKLYGSLGFVETGDADGDEIVFRLNL